MCVLCKIIADQRDTSTMIEMDTAGAGLLSSPADVFSRESTTSTGAAQRQSPWPLGPSPRTADPQPGGDVSDSAGGGPSTAAVSGGVPAATFSPRLGDGQFTGSRAPSFYGADTDTSPPRLQPNNDYRPTSGKSIVIRNLYYHQNKSRAATKEKIKALNYNLTKYGLNFGILCENFNIQIHSQI